MKIVIVGAGGNGRSILWTLQDCNKISKKYEILGFIDDAKSFRGEHVNHVPVLGGIEWFSTDAAKNVSCAVAIGDGKIRQKVVKKLEEKGVKFPVIIHPSVICSEIMEIGKGTIIQAGSIISVNTKIGSHVDINFGCTVGHDAILDDYVTLAPGVHINGNTIIESGTYVGSGAVTKQGIKIGKWSHIGAGTVLTKNIPEFSIYLGVPGKMKSFKS